MLSFKLLGSVVLAQNGIELSHFRSQKEAALLIYLAHTEDALQRDFLATLFWESSTTKQSLTNLRTALARLRKQVDDALVVTRKTVAISPAHLERVDATFLLHELSQIDSIDTPAQAKRLQHALDSYHGEFLADFKLNGAPQFEDWVTQTREQIRRQVITSYEKLAQYTIAHGTAGQRLAIAEQWLTADPLDEAAHTLKIQAHLDVGEKNEALAHYEYSSALLLAELGIEPSDEMTALVSDARPRQQTHSRLSSTIRHNIPTTYDQFFGREAIQDEIHVRLDQPWCRVVTIMGQGGVGKTRLATAVAQSRLKQYPDGVWFIELADIDPDDEDIEEAIAVEIATILDMRLTGSAPPIDQVLDHLKHKQMMLVLDNFEHLMGADLPLVMPLIKKCKNIQLLVTSREPLQIRAEWTIQLSGLSYPQNGEDGMSYEAVELFLARRAQQRHKTASGEDMQAIRAICRMVEGLPLALELAAALTRQLSVQQVLEQLQEGYDVLATSMRDVPRRHRTLHIVFGMSWETLSAHLQERLARLSVFRGGFTMTAAEEITEADSYDLMDLIDKSLLRFHDEQERYTLHPIIQAYAAEKRPSGSKDGIDGAHGRFYLDLLTDHAEPLQKNEPQLSMALLEPDIENIRQAWQTGLAQGEYDQLVSALPALSVYYQLRGLAYEGESVMHSTLQTAVSGNATSTTLAIRAGLEHTRFQNRLGQHQQAIKTIKETVGLAQTHEDEWGEGIGHVWWGEALWRIGEYETAEQKLNHALVIGQRIQANDIIGWCHHQLGIINDIQSRYDKAVNSLEKACQSWELINDAQALSKSFNSLGLVYYHQGQLQKAQESLEKALHICDQLGDTYLHMYLTNNLSLIATEQNDYAGANYYLTLGLQVAISSGSLSAQSNIYNNLGRNYLYLEQLELGLKHLEEGLKISESIVDYPLMATSLINIGKIKYKQDSFKSSESYFLKALNIARKNSLQNLIAEALISIAELYSEIDRKRALGYSGEAMMMIEKIQNRNLIERVQEIDSLLHAQT